MSLGPGAAEAAAGVAANPQSVTMAMAQDVWRRLGQPNVDLEGLRVGMEVEQGHTGDLDEAAKIALDHLSEFGDYYARLTKMEERATRGLSPNALTPNRPPLDDIVEALRQTPALAEDLGLAPVTYAKLEERIVGVGFYAYAFMLELGLVLKVTDDPDDAGAAELLRKFRPTIGLPHVLEVKRLPGTWTRNETDAAEPRYLYAIVMEAVQPASTYLTRAEQRDLRWAFKDALRIDTGTRRQRFEGEDFTITPRMHRLMEPILKGLRWLDQRGYRITDLHASNVGIAAGNRPVVFDFGHGSRSDQASSSPSIDLATNGELPRSRKHFDRCFDVVEGWFPDFGDCELHVDERAGADNGAGAARQYGYCKDGDPIVIAFAMKVEELPDENISGLMRHEFGHALDYRYGDDLGRLLGRRLPDGVERRADAIAEAVFGEPIEYDERLVQCVDCGGVAPRPRRLPR